MEKLLILSSAVLMALSLFSCGDTAESQVSQSSSEIAAQPETEPPFQSLSSPAKVKQSDSKFREYPSNTFIATGNNNIASADSTTYRGYFPVEQYGELEYCFYFSNTVDSTYDKGKKAYVGLAGGDYKIESAFVADGGTDPANEEVINRTPVTFGGQTEKSVSSGEKFWSDPIDFEVPEGHYLVWEWTLTGENIPAIAMSSLTKVGIDQHNDKPLGWCDEIPMPQLIGAKRDVKYNIAAIGDSITQGCQTESLAFEFWAARISQALGSEYSFWNCGLGWSRSSDAASGGDWLERTAEYADAVIVAFGTNDIISGEYGGDGGNTAQEIDSYVRTLLDKFQDEDCSIIVFNAPPEDYREDMEAVRTEYNEILKSTCEEYGVFYFDFASCLSEESNPAHALYGGHPNGEGGQIVADKFMEDYSAFLDIPS